jgi:purine-binding chemotaxis protein CheW
MTREEVSSDAARETLLLCRVDARLYGLPLRHVVETMRPLPFEPLPGAPPYIRGVSVIRGDTVPIVDTAVLLGANESHPGRLVTVAVDDRRIALAVDAVVGIREVPGPALHDLPPLLDNVSAESITAIGTLDAELLLVLRSTRLVPDFVWESMDVEGAPTCQ